MFKQTGCKVAIQKKRAVESRLNDDYELPGGQGRWNIFV